MSNDQSQAEIRENVRQIAKQLWDYEKAHGAAFAELAPDDYPRSGLIFRGCSFVSSADGLRCDSYKGQAVSLLFTEADLAQ